MDIVTTLDAALACYDGGLVPIPLKPQSKAPSIHWQEWQRRRPDRDLVRRWFTYHQGNVGVMTCAVSGGLVVLDFDQVEAFDAWRAGCRPESYTVTTGCGMHVYLRVDDLPGASFALPGLDVKASGYVVGAGSVHPSGARYTGNGATVARIGALSEVGIVPAVVGKSPTGGNHARVNTHTRIIPPQAIKARLPILAFLESYTDTTRARSGRFCVVRCPWPSHEDIHPSFQVDRVTGNACCLVPSCPLHDRRGLDVIDLYQALEGVTFSGAVRALSQRVML